MTKRNSQLFIWKFTNICFLRCKKKTIVAILTLFSYLGGSFGQYEADVEESGADNNNHGKDGSWSDSESGFLHPPIKLGAAERRFFHFP